MSRHPTRPLPGALCLSLALALALPGLASAQVSVPPTIEPSASQEDALRRGTEAYRVKDYAAAVKAYDEVLKIGPLNIALLNKGRALQRLGDCNGAADAFVRVLDAPAVTEPSPDTVRGALTRYQQQLANECPGTLVVTCDPMGAKLQFVDTPERKAADLPRIGCGTLVELPPGAYNIIARAHQQTERHRITIVGVQTQTLAIQITPLSQIDQGMDTMAFLGWSTLGLSGVALAAGVLGSVQLTAENEAMEQLAAKPSVTRTELEDALDRAQLYQVVQWTGYGVAVAAAAVGLVLLDQSDSGPSLTPAAGKGRAGALLTIPF